MQLPSPLRASQTWLTAAIETATGKVTVTATPNETTQLIVTTLTLEHSGVLRSAPETIVITVKQKAKKPEVELHPQKLGTEVSLLFVKPSKLAIRL